MVLPSASPRDAQPTELGPQRQAAIWRSIGERLAVATPAGARANKLGALAARSLRAGSRPVPPDLAEDARMARAAWMTAIPLLGRIRALWDGPLLLIKGPEVAALYPDRARNFSDIDLLVADPEGLHETLRANGFVEVDEPEIYANNDQHHLRPLQWPALWLWVEIHLRPLWPEGRTPPPVDEIVAAAVPSATGVDGLLAPEPAHH